MILSEKIADSIMPEEFVFGNIYPLKSNFKKIPIHIFGIAERLFKFLSVSSLWIAGLGFFKTLIGYFLLGLDPSLLVCLTVFLISFSVYSLDKIADIEKDIINMPERKSFLYGRKNLVFAYSVAAYLTAVVLTFMDNPIALPLVFLPFLANAFYGTKLLPWIPRLKDIPVMKNVVVATTWALITALLPGAHMDGWPIFQIGLVFYFLLVKTFIDTVLYDIRDVAGDREAGVRTMPVLLGERKTVVVLLALNSTLLPWLAFADSAIRSLAFVLTIYGYAYILYLRQRRNPLVLDILVEGEWMMATILLVLFGVIG